MKDDPKHIRDGESIVPLLKQTGGLKRKEIYWHYPHYNNGNQGFASPFTVVRQGDFRLVEFLEDGRHELYDLRVRELSGKLKAWRKEVGAQSPIPNPNYDPVRAWDMNTP